MQESKNEQAKTPERPLRRVKRGWMNLKVTKVVEETWDTKTFVFEDLEESGRNWDYESGQYLTFRFDDLSVKPIVRSYTMSSSPIQPKDCAVTIKRVEGGLVSNWFCDKVKVGDVLRARGPIGKFCYFPQEDKQHLVMVAAGSGVTPFVSIMREFGRRQKLQPIPALKMTLIVSYRSRQDLILWEDLESLTHVNGFRVITTLSRDKDAPSIFKQGRIDDLLLEEVIASERHNMTVMTCGPEVMMQNVKAFCQKIGMLDSQFKMESFES